MADQLMMVEKVKRDLRWSHSKLDEDICFKLQIAGIAFMGLRLKYRKGAALLTIGTAA